MFDQPEHPLVSYSSRGQEKSQSVFDVLAGSPSCGAGGRARILSPVEVDPPRQLLELACKSVNAVQGGIGFVSSAETTGEAELTEFLAFGLPERVVAKLWRSPWLLQMLRTVQQQPGPLCAADWACECPHLQPPPDLLAEGLPPFGPFLAVPFTNPGRSRGVLYLARLPNEPVFSSKDLELASLISSWLEKGSLFEEARLLGQLRLYNKLAQAATGNFDLSRLIAVALRELGRHLPLHVGAVWLTEPAHDAQRQDDDAAAAAGPRPSTLSIAGTFPPDGADSLGLTAGLCLASEQTPFAACLDNSQALYLDLASPQETNGFLAANLAARGATCSFAVPLRAGDRTLGVLQSVCTRPGGFTQEQIQVLYLAADLLGPAISNCQLFGHLRSAYEELRLTQGQLIEAEKLRALGEMASGMAHEFNNSLCGALGFLELAVADEDLNPSCRGYLQSARTCALDAAQTVRQVQDFARQGIPDGRELPVEAFDLNELVRQTVELTRSKWENQAQKQGKTITVRVQTGARARVSGNAVELRKALTNLILNAVDAMSRGGVLTLRTWDAPADVCCSVHDTGVGMNEEVRQRLFEPFFTTKKEGSGLGLSVTFGIIRRHGGQIAVESEPGNTTFTLRLPAAEDASNDTPGQPCPARERRANDRSLRVLVVEDEAYVRRFLETVLTRLGHRPRLTADGSEGLAAFREECFDVVLTDLGLPGMTGEELARTIAQRSPEIPVVLLTGWADQLQTEKDALPGVTKVLGKPVTVDTLATTLTAVCSKN